MNETLNTLSINLSEEDSSLRATQPTIPRNEEMLQFLSESQKIAEAYRRTMIGRYGIILAIFAFHA
ncbi:MAG: hypothetical protein ABSB12_01455 [Candidatus Saccharimonadales bacterium]